MYFFSFLGILTALLFGIVQLDLICPVCDDTMTVEIDSQKEDSCDEGYYWVDKAFCNCFPACLPVAGFREFCDDNDVCAPGLTCVKDDDGDFICNLDRTSCLHYNFITPDSFKHELLWKPNCLPDGSYAPKQCKGEIGTGRCFCYDAKGNRIFGEQWWSQSENMTCACSRRMAELQQQGITNLAFHCDTEGNYETLQCSAGMCWCVDRITGEIEDTVLPESSISKLKCYKADEIGKQYLRLCDSELVAQNELEEKLEYHGTTAESMVSIKCDFDGSYGPIQFFGTIAACTAKDKSKIKTYQTESIKYAEMDCHCAQDEMVFSAAGMDFQLACQVNGNYEATQELGGRLFCIDSDGYPISKMLDTTDKINCTNWIYELLAS